MDKKNGKRRSTNNTNKNKSSKKCKSQKNNNNVKFSDFTYPELVVLSATLAYSLSEELDEDDLAIFLVFLGLLLAEMEVIVAQRALEKKNSSISAEEEEEDVDIDIGETE